MIHSCLILLSAGDWARDLQRKVGSCQLQLACPPVSTEGAGLMVVVRVVGMGVLSASSMVQMAVLGRVAVR